MCRRRRRRATTLYPARLSRGRVGKRRSCSAASPSVSSASCCSVGSSRGSSCRERPRASALVRARSLARGRRRRRGRALRLARPRDVARSAARRRRADRRAPQVRHGFDAALAASVPRPLLQLHATRGPQARRERAPVTTNRRWWSGMLATEDWWSVWIGLGIFALGLASLLGLDLVGWHALASFAATYVVFTALFALGARFMRLDVRRFVVGFTVLFVVTWAAWIAGNELHLTMVDATVDGRNRYSEAGLSWGLQLGEGAPYLLALLAGLALGNFGKSFAAKRLGEAARPEWYIKTAIVFLGVNLGAQTLDASGFAGELILTGAAATFVAYLFFWPIVYFAARRLFGFKLDVAAVVASGISVCGASAAIATGGAIRAKPIIPVTVSMVVVIFAMLELIVLPGAYTALFPDQPVVNGAALGMTVKTDGADAAAGALLDDLMRAAHVAATGEQWQAGWILSASILTKLWIDVFIGVWAFVLALVWVYKVEKRAGAVSISPAEIWFRFPKFVLGYFVAWLSY